MRLERWPLIQRKIYSSICLYQTYAIDIVIRDVHDRDYNTSKANKPISYNIYHQTIHLYSIGLLDYTKRKHNQTFTCYTIDNSKIRNYFITGDLLR